MTKYLVVAEGLMYPTDPKVIARLKSGENVPMAQRGVLKQPAPGTIVDDIPAVSVPWLLADGHIVPAPEVKLG